MDSVRRRFRMLGLGLIGVAAVLGLIALEHMRALAAYGVICGGAAPHCPACPASLASLALGVTLLTFAGRAPRRRRVPAKV